MTWGPEGVEPLPAGVRPIGEDRREPAEIAREDNGKTRGLDDLDREEWHGVAMRLADALREIGELARKPMRADEQLAVIYQTVADALAAEGLDE